MIRVDPSRSQPLFAQVVESVKHAVATARLRPGDRLPSVRELARELVINPNTIARAYQVLEAEGVTHSRRGAGTFVAGGRRSAIRRSERQRRFREALESVLSDAVHLGLTEEEVHRGFEAVCKRFRFDGVQESKA